MTFYETSVFTDQIIGLIDDDSYAELQSALVIDPEAGDLMPRCKGLRKIRWRAAGKGKRGGIRVICYLLHRDEVYMLYAYPKNKRTDIAAAQARMLRDLVDQHLES